MKTLADIVVATARFIVIGLIIMVMYAATVRATVRIVKDEWRNNR